MSYSTDYSTRPRRLRDCDDADVARAVAAARCTADALRALGFNAGRDSYPALQRRIERLGLSTDHWRRRRPSRRNPDAALAPGGYAPQTNRSRIKRRLIAAGELREVCRVCGLGPVWNGRPLTLRLDHVNGDASDWRRENLGLICPNCDSQQPTYCGRNARRRRVRPVKA